MAAQNTFSGQSSRIPEASSSSSFSTYTGETTTVLSSTLTSPTISAVVSPTGVTSSSTSSPQGGAFQVSTTGASSSQVDTNYASTSSAGSSDVGASASQARATQSAQPAKSGSTGLSGGAVAGVAIAALIIGALIASAVFFVLQKKRREGQRSQRGIALETVSTRNRPDEKPALTTVNVVPQNETFDLDRLLPQPFDDSRIKSEVQTLFEQIDGHIENFYTESNVSSKTHVSTDASESEMLLYPRTRFFALKRLVCLAMLDAIGVNCQPEHSLLPLGFGTITRQLKGVDLDEPANALCWARLRSSMGYLLQPDLGTLEQERLDRVVGAMVRKLNAQTQLFELAGTANQRAVDMDAICRSSAMLGRVLLSQPAEWKFDWRRTAGIRTGLVYFPSLVRLTDNKGKKLRTPQVAIHAKITRSLA